MVVTTKAQRKALKAVYDRGVLYPAHNEYTGSMTGNMTYAESFKPLTYRQFRERVYPGYDCIMLHWCGLWLGIEPDGYTHS